MADLALVVARTETNGIGFQGKLPWHPKSLKADMNWFKRLTVGGFRLDAGGEFEFPVAETPSVVVMGRRTWDSIPARFRPLPQRSNFVLTRTQPAGEMYAAADVRFIGGLHELPERQVVFVIGGAECYRIAMETGRVKYVFCTQIIESPGNPLECDTFFPPFAGEQCTQPVDITHMVSTLIDAGISAATYDPQEGCFVEHGIRYKMVVFVLQQPA